MLLTSVSPPFPDYPSSRHTTRSYHDVLPHALIPQPTTYPMPRHLYKLTRGPAHLHITLLPDPQTILRSPRSKLSCAFFHIQNTSLVPVSLPHTSCTHTTFQVSLYPHSHNRFLEADAVSLVNFPIQATISRGCFRFFLSPASRTPFNCPSLLFSRRAADFGAQDQRRA